MSTRARLPELERRLNSLFGRPARSSTAPAIGGYVLCGTLWNPITKRGPLWTIHLGDRRFDNSHLGDLVAQVKREGFRYVNRASFDKGGR